MYDILISARKLTKVYEGEVVANDEINLDIYKGEIFGLLGPNGAGKTTLIRQIAGLLKPTSGQIFFEDYDIVKRNDIIPEYISYFGQQLFVLNSHRVWEAIYYTGLFRGLNKQTALKQTDLLLSMFDMTKLRKRLITKLSGGQKKLVGIMTALIGLRPIIILDEPTNDLDPENRKKVWEIISYLNSTYNTTILLVTHNVLEAEQVVSRVAIIDEGKIIGLGTPAELKNILGDQVRLEIYLKDEYKEGLLDDKKKFFNQEYKAEIVQAGVLRIISEKQLINEVLDQAIAQIGLEKINDFRVITGTLEDVYLALGGVENAIK